MHNLKSHELSGESCAVEFDPLDTAHALPVGEREALMAIDGVEGFGISGTRQVCVFVRDRDVRSKLPAKIGDLEVVVRTVGVVRSQ